MAIRLFFKHLFRSIGNRPMQPILLVMVVAIAVAINTFAMQLDDLMEEEASGEFTAENGVSNIVVSAASSGDANSTRFLDPTLAEEYFANLYAETAPEEPQDGREYEGYARVCGIYALPFYNMSDNKIAKGVLTDFDKVEYVFQDLKFDNIPTDWREVQTCVYLSKDYAEKYGLRKGDYVELSLCGNEQTYKVYGVASQDIMGEYDVMVDARSALYMLLGYASSIIGEYISPYGKLYIYLDVETYQRDLIAKYNEEGYIIYGDYVYTDDFVAPTVQSSKQSCEKSEEVVPTQTWEPIDKIDTSALRLKIMGDLGELYPGGSVQTNDSESGSLGSILEDILEVFVILTVALAVANIFCCFSILTAQRTSANELLNAVGAKQYMLNILSMVEMAMYWLIGSAVGLALSVPLLKMVGVVADFQYCVPKLNINEGLKAAGIMLAATEASMVLFIVIGRIKTYLARHKKPETEEKTAVKKVKGQIVNFVGIALIITVVAMMINMFLTEQDIREEPGIPTIVVFLVMLFYNGRLVFRQVSVKLSGVTKFPVALRYAIKNSSRVDSQSNVASLFSVVVIICVLVLILALSVESMSNTWKGLIDADYVAINMTAGAKEDLKHTEGVAQVYDAFAMKVRGFMYDGEYTYDEIKDDAAYHNQIGRYIYDYKVISATDAEAFADSFGLQEKDQPLPVGKQAYLAQTCLDTYNLDIGDKVALFIDGQWYNEIVIVDTFRANDNMIILDIGGLGANYNYVAIKGEEGYDKELLYSNVFERCSTDNIVITTPQELLADEVRNMDIYLACIKIVVVSVIIFSSIGMLDSIASAYRSRRGQFRCYIAAGMNRKTLKIMKFSETAYSFTIGMLYTIVMFGVGLLIVYETMLGFDINIFI